MKERHFLLVGEKLCLCYAIVSLVLRRIPSESETRSTGYLFSSFAIGGVAAALKAIAKEPQGQIQDSNSLGLWLALWTGLETGDISS
jgi:hypothetical protein